MKNVTPELLALMQSNQQFIIADLYTITTAAGTVLRYTDFDTDLSYGGNVFSASGPVLKRGKTRIVIGLEVDTLDVEIYPSPTDTIGGQSWLSAATAGVFDGATLKLERAFISPVPTVVGALIMFTGVFADLETARAMVSIRVNSDLAALQVQVPRNLYQASCLNVLYGADCKAVRATYAVNSTVTARTLSKILCGLAQAEGYFDTGYVVFTSGVLAGTRRTIKAYKPGQFTVYNPFPSIPGIGDAFTVYPGCDKALETCGSKFNNRLNFRGFPFIPVPETSI